MVRARTLIIVVLAFLAVSLVYFLLNGVGVTGRFE